MRHLNAESAIFADFRCSLSGQPRMIEFTIPLNLPVRAVAISGAMESPPEWIAMEMSRWAARARKKISAASENTEPTPPPPPTESELELQSLRGQRALFLRGVEELRQATRQYEQRLEGMIHEFELATVELAHAISAKLIFESVESDRFPIDNLVHEVITRLDTSAGTVVHLHPDDLNALQQYRPIEGVDSESSVQFIPDSTLSRGDCRAKSGDMSVVYELKRQIEEIRRQLLSTVNGHAEN
jgi:flagellar biosynthesis/type III secretory pathway protein FliH